MQAPHFYSNNIAYDASNLTDLNGYVIMGTNPDFKKSTSKTDTSDKSEEYFNSSIEDSNHALLNSAPQTGPRDSKSHEISNFSDFDTEEDSYWYHEGYSYLKTAFENEDENLEPGADIE